MEGSAQTEFGVARTSAEPPLFTVRLMCTFSESVAADVIMDGVEIYDVMSCTCTFCGLINICGILHYM